MIKRVLFLAVAKISQKDETTKKNVQKTTKNNLEPQNNTLFSAVVRSSTLFSTGSHVHLEPKRLPLTIM
jgi:hypothetical protein